MSIDPRAVIDPGAHLAEDVTVGPFSVIGANVEIGEGCWIGPHVVINGPTIIGRENRIFQFASVGETPQDKKFHGENSKLVIGDSNTIREFVTIHRGTEDGGGTTSIGNDNWLMAYIHIAHDCIIGDHTIFSNGASLAGHVQVDDYAILGGFTLVHQFCHIGTQAFCGMGSAISKDVTPYTLVNGNPAHPHGLNVEGLKRQGYSSELIRELRDAYKTVYRMGITAEEARSRLSEAAEKYKELQLFVDFIKNSSRGILR
ncbi:Acyl-[acyl-carrier-protein]--UDP-N-acetylglucosamine O-acyltransferase [hydrothermal vent metagenome]|uniref:Acyl-[acyl-carrier-protein]--UDP-N-acetylglucosamine O-acyltransferase n=1 Tax=hydrothermal vent metagenome TaxID=652676 RepID=A0A3B1AL27_9ZZZZ